MLKDLPDLLPNSTVKKNVVPSLHPWSTRSTRRTRRAQGVPSWLIFCISPAHWIMIDASRPKFYSLAAVLWQDGAIHDFSCSMRPLKNLWGLVCTSQVESQPPAPIHIILRARIMCTGMCAHHVRTQHPKRCCPDAYISTPKHTSAPTNHHIRYRCT